MNTTKDEVQVPPGTYLVQSPYELKHKNTSISRSFLVFTGGATDPMVPDVRLQTKNALLHSAVYINDQDWGRAVSVHAKTKNADIVLEVHTMQADQAVGIRSSTKNGRNKIFLPRDFAGSLEVSTKNGKCTLSDDLRKVALRRPSLCEKMVEDDDSFDSSTSLETSDCSLPTSMSNGVGVEYQINGGGPSAAIIDTKNGNVYVGFVEEEEEDDDEKEEAVGCCASCSVM